MTHPPPQDPNEGPPREEPDVAPQQPPPAGAQPPPAGPQPPPAGDQPPPGSPAPQYPAQPPRKNKTWLWILLGVLGLIILCCVLSTLIWGGDDQGGPTDDPYRQQLSATAGLAP